MSNIIKAPVASQAVELSEGKKRQFFRESMKMLGTGMALGFQGKLITAAACWNIRELGLHELEELSLKEFAEKAGMSERSFFAYCQVGDRIASSRTTTNGIPIITQKDVKEVFEASTAAGIDYTLRGLFKAAQSQEAFNKYLSTGKIEEVEAEAKKLLKPRKLTDAELQEQSEKDALKAKAATQADSSAHAWARQYGLKWDKERGWINDDGTDLSDEQRADMTAYCDALEVWVECREAIGIAAAALYKAIHKGGHAYKLFDSRGNKKFKNEVSADRRTIVLNLERMENMISHLAEGDIAQAEAAYKED